MTDEVHLPPTAKVIRLSFDEAKGFEALVRAELAGYVDAGLLTLSQARFERSYLTNLGIYDFWGAQWWGAVEDGELQGIHAAKFNSGKRQNAWGRYVNHYLAFTRPSRRRQGFGTGIEFAIEADARAAGFDRLKTTCQSWLGFSFHERCRHEFWGVNDKGELVLDTPLHDATFPPGVPIKVRKVNVTGAEMTDDEIVAALTDPSGRFRRTADEVAPFIAKRPWRRAEPRPARELTVAP